MNGGAYTLATAPLLPWWLIASLGALSLLIVSFGLFQRARGIFWRIAAIAVVLVIMVNPSLVEEKRDPQRDVAVVVVDESASQRIGERGKFSEAAFGHITEKLATQKDLDVRVVRAGKPGEGAMMNDGGTQLFTALNHAIADVPRQRLAGVAMITDGQVHDVPDLDHLGIAAPVHVLLSGQPNEADRRLIVTQAPSFGLVGKELQLTIRVEDLPGPAAAGTRARISLRKDAGSAALSFVPVGRDVTLSVNIDHGGPNVIELEVEAGPQELTLDNNRAAVVVNGVRDRLKVLLVSGEPHAGERTWRNILKSDP
jgi:hypothetical protein